MKVTTPGFGLKVPGPRQYLMAEVFAPTYEDTVDDESATDMALATVTNARRRMQLADVEAMLQQLPALFEKAIASGERVVRPTSPVKAAELPAELRSDLRKAAARLRELTGQEINVPPPTSEEEARKVLAQMRASVYDLEKRRPT